MTENSNKILSATGRMIPVRGDAIDTDRIIPARFLRCVTFDGLGEHAFEDDRQQLGGKHSFDDPKFSGASILLVNKNFGCGSSREHAPQALMRWGINLVIGESFAEIFFGNCLALGVPCLTMDAADVETLMAHAESQPTDEAQVDIKSLTVAVGAIQVQARLPRGPHESLVAGTWDATGQLLANFDEVEAVAKSLPYVGGF